MIDLIAQLPEPTSYQAVGWLTICLAAVVAIAVSIQKFIINQRVLSGNLPPQPRRNSDDEKVMTEDGCGAVRKQEREYMDVLIKLRSTESISNYEAEAKKARKLLHDQMTELKVEVGQLGERTQTTNRTLEAINGTLQNVSQGLANLAGTQGKG